MAERDEALRIVEGHTYRAWHGGYFFGEGVATGRSAAVLVIGATADYVRAALKAHRGDTGGTDGQG